MEIILLIGSLILMTGLFLLKTKLPSNWQSMVTIIVSLFFLVWMWWIENTNSQVKWIITALMLAALSKEFRKWWLAGR